MMAKLDLCYKAMMKVLGVEELALRIREELYYLYCQD
jgi:hypothetical protein